MIPVSRRASPVYLNSARVTTWTNNLCQNRVRYYQDLARYHHIGGTKPKRPRANDSHYGHSDVRGELKIMFGSKCAYCESEVSASSPQHVEHYRPAARYPSLAYQWENLLLACPHCNSTHKSDHFPIAPSGNTPGELRRNPCARNGAGETPFLLNPCDDIPEDHLRFQDARLVAISERGRYTRRVCGLNRDDLLSHRLLWLRIVQRSVEEYLIAVLERDVARQDRHAEDLRLFVDKNAPYAGMARQELSLHGIDWRTL